MGKIMSPEYRNEQLIQNLLTIWEASVIETHTFLTATDIQEIKPDVVQGIQHIEQLVCYYENQQILGFIGVQQAKIEMLFVDPQARGKGVGKELVSYVLKNLRVEFVDVNEQNEQAVGFYKHLGFRQFSRSDVDEQERPFPILHMKK